MTTLNRQIQSKLIKLHITQALNDFGIEAEASKKKVTANYKQSYRIQ